MVLVKWSFFKWRNCVWEEDLSLSAWGTEQWNSTRHWRFGLTKRIEGILDMVRRGDGLMPMSERMVRDVIRDSNKSRGKLRTQTLSGE